MSSINKISSATLKLKRINFTTIPNNVINGMHDGDAFLMWSYLLSKNEDWEIIKSHLCNHFGWNIKKVNRLFNVLYKHGLATWEQPLDEYGKFLKPIITIDGGSNFKPLEEEIHRNPKNGIAVNPPCGKRHTSNKRDNTKERGNKKKRKDLEPKKKKIDCPSDFKPTDKHIELCSEYDLDCEFQLKKCISWHGARGNKFTCWNKTFTNWLLKAHEINMERGAINHDKLQKRGILFESCRKDLEEFRQETDTFGYPLIAQMD